MTFNNRDGFFDLLPTAPTSKRKPKPPNEQPLEKEIQDKVIKALRKRGVFVSRTNAAKINIKDQAKGRYDKGRYVNGVEPGHSDLAGCLAPAGRAWYIEMKRPGEGLTKLQATFLAKRAAEGCITGVADSVETALRILGFEPTRYEKE